MNERDFWRLATRLAEREMAIVNGAGSTHAPLVEAEGAYGVELRGGEIAVE